VYPAKSWPFTSPQTGHQSLHVPSLKEFGNPLRGPSQALCHCDTDPPKCLRRKGFERNGTATRQKFASAATCKVQAVCATSCIYSDDVPRDRCANSCTGVHPGAVGNDRRHGFFDGNQREKPRCRAFSDIGRAHCGWHGDGNRKREPHSGTLPGGARRGSMKMMIENLDGARGLPADGIGTRYGLMKPPAEIAAQRWRTESADACLHGST
jgi:hypothetical protein